ncbi:hypothetical protein J5X84_36405 [Streptosporangiaceae bacterium NEAU-GS5]|nr:hypothetical protein [Streptosporangiaceae bacterium NEAU-GS5]
MQITKPAPGDRLEPEALGRIYAALATYAAQTTDDTPLYLALVAADHEVPPLDLIDRVQRDYYDRLVVAYREDAKRLMQAAEEAQMRREWGAEPAAPGPELDALTEAEYAAEKADYDDDPTDEEAVLA